MRDAFNYCILSCPCCPPALRSCRNNFFEYSNIWTSTRWTLPSVFVQLLEHLGAERQGLLILLDVKMWNELASRACHIQVLFSGLSYSLHSLLHFLPCHCLCDKIKVQQGADHETELMDSQPLLMLHEKMVGNHFFMWCLSKPRSFYCYQWFKFYSMHYQFWWACKGGEGEEMSLWQSLPWEAGSGMGDMGTADGSPLWGRTQDVPSQNPWPLFWWGCFPLVALPDVDQRIGIVKERLEMVASWSILKTDDISGRGIGSLLWCHWDHGSWCKAGGTYPSSQPKGHSASRRRGGMDTFGFQRVVDIVLNCLSPNANREYRPTLARLLPGRSSTAQSKGRRGDREVVLALLKTWW